FHPPERVAQKALEAWELGATEVCMQGGLAAQLTPQRYLEYLRAVKDPLPEMHVHAFSPAEIDWAMRKWEGSLEEYLRMLREAGLDSTPGTAAEILVDEVRREIAHLAQRVADDVTAEQRPAGRVVVFAVPFVSATTSGCVALPLPVGGGGVVSFCTAAGASCGVAVGCSGVGVGDGVGAGAGAGASLPPWFCTSITYA
ncbi:MAG: hypothetical protein ABR562_09610, partial [Thermoplasmatota archaeon]